MSSSLYFEIIHDSLNNVMGVVLGQSIDIK